MKLPNLLEPARTAWENLNDREKKLVLLLSMVMGAIAVLLPLYLATSSISELEDENSQLTDVLREIERNRGKLSQRAAERKAAEQRYGNKAPPLASFVDEKARQAGLKLRGDVTDQPEKVLGAFRRRGVRVKLPGVGLKSVVDLMTTIENSPYPVAVDFVRFEHYQSGDQYNVDLGVIAFDKTRKTAKPNASEGVSRSDTAAE